MLRVDRGGGGDGKEGGTSGGTVEVHWEVGEAFVFDDSLVHGVDYCAGAIDGGERNRRQHKDTSSSRVVLIVDLWHPDLKMEERRLLRDLYPAV